MWSTGLLVGCEGNAWSTVGDSEDQERHLRSASKAFGCEVVKLLNSAFSGVRVVAMDTLERRDAFDQDELAVWEAFWGRATQCYFQRRYDGILKFLFCSYCLPCSLQLGLCPSWSSPPAWGTPHGLKTLPPPSSPHFGPMSADPQEKHNVLPEEKDHLVRKLNFKKTKKQKKSCKYQLLKLSGILLFPSGKIHLNICRQINIY